MSVKQFKKAGVTDHGKLGGLTDDDHTQYVLHTDVDDTPVNGVTDDPVSSNWAYDHAADTDAHHEAAPTTHRTRAYPASDQDIPSGSWTKVVLGSESYDPGSHFADSKYTVAKEGIYLITAIVCFNENLSDTKAVWSGIYKNGALYQFTSLNLGAAGKPSVSLTLIEELEVDDYIELYIQHNNGTNREIDATYTFLAIQLIGE
jgi:hypothetical protein